MKLTFATRANMAELVRVPAVDDWFTIDAEPRLIGSRCVECGTYYFPKETFSCRNPSCSSTVLEEVPLSNTGKIWSYAINHYPPPPPAVSSDPFEPYAVAAVELAEERMIVLGLVSGDIEALRIGADVELVVDTLFKDEVNDNLVWKWVVR